MTTKVNKVIEIFSAKKGQSGLPRPRVDKLELIENFGIKDDKFAGKDIDRTIMVVGKIAYDIAYTKDINLKLGSLGENILLDFNPHEFKLGTRFKIGKTIIEITENCTICNHLAKFDNNLPKLVENCRGIYCKIICGGEIKKGSTVEIINQVQNNRFAS